MSSFLTILTVVYLLVGIAVYIVTTEKVKAVEHTVESHVPVNPVGYKSVIFLVIILAWPIWIFIQGLIHERQGPF